jgi:predicted DNA-binding antitoxin AbrB/MazE fold protein
MSSNPITIEAVFDGSVFRPIKPVSLSSPQQVTLVVRPTISEKEWPDDVAAIYQEIEAEDRRLADAMVPGMLLTWPPAEEQP